MDYLFYKQGKHCKGGLTQVHGEYALGENKKKQFKLYKMSS